MPQLDKPYILCLCDYWLWKKENIKSVPFTEQNAAFSPRYWWLIKQSEAISCILLSVNGGKFFLEKYLLQTAGVKCRPLATNYQIWLNVSRTLFPSDKIDWKRKASELFWEKVSVKFVSSKPLLWSVTLLQTACLGIYLVSRMRIVGWHWSRHWRLLHLCQFGKCQTLPSKFDCGICRDLHCRKRNRSSSL